MFDLFNSLSFQLRSDLKMFLNLKIAFSTLLRHGRFRSRNILGPSFWRTKNVTQLFQPTFYFSWANVCRLINFYSRLWDHLVSERPLFSIWKTLIIFFTWKSFISSRTFPLSDKVQCSNIRVRCVVRRKN